MFVIGDPEEPQAEDLPSVRKGGGFRPLEWFQSSILLMYLRFGS